MKAYTSVAVKMSTKELSVLAQPGGTFYRVDKMDGGKIVIFGGGIPLKVDSRIIGGLGISGGTGEGRPFSGRVRTVRPSGNLIKIREPSGDFTKFPPEVFLCTFLESLIY